MIVKQIFLFSLFYASSLVICSEGNHKLTLSPQKTPCLVVKKEQGTFQQQQQQGSLKRPLTLNTTKDTPQNKRIKKEDERTVQPCPFSLNIDSHQNHVNTTRLEQEYNSLNERWDSIRLQQKRAWDTLLATDQGKAYTTAQKVFRRGLLPAKGAIVDKAMNDLMKTNEYENFIKIDDKFAYFFYKRHGLRAIKKDTSSREEMVKNLNSGLLIIDPNELTENRKEILPQVESELLSFINEITQ